MRKTRERESHFHETRRSIDEAFVGANKQLLIPCPLGEKLKFEFCQRENHQMGGREGNVVSARKSARQEKILCQERIKELRNKLSYDCFGVRPII